MVTCQMADATCYCVCANTLIKKHCYSYYCLTSRMIIWGPSSSILTLFKGILKLLLMLNT